MPDYFDYVEKPPNWDKFPLFGIVDERACMEWEARHFIERAIDKAIQNAETALRVMERGDADYAYHMHSYNDSMTAKDDIKNWKRLRHVLESVPSCSSIRGEATDEDSMVGLGALFG